MDVKKTMNGFVFCDNFGTDLFYMRPVFDEKTGALEIKIKASYAVKTLKLTKTENGYFGREVCNSPAQAERDKLRICSTCACYMFNKNTEPCKNCDGIKNNRWRSIK